MLCLVVGALTSATACAGDTDGAESNQPTTTSAAVAQSDETVAFVTLGPTRIALVDRSGRPLGEVSLPPSLAPTEPDLSPVEPRLAYVAIDDGEGRIRVSDLDGSDAENVDAGQSIGDGCPRWFSDGERLLVRSASREGDGELRVVSLAGSVEAVPLPIPAAEIGCGDPVPSDNRIVFPRHTDDDLTGLWSVGLDGDGLVQLVSMPGCSAVSPSVSPDGSTVAFVVACSDAQDWGIYTVPIGGGAPEQVVGENETATLSTATTEPGGPAPADGVAAGQIVRYGWPNWSPDGSELLFSRIPADGDPDDDIAIWTVDLATGESHPLIDAPASFGTWSSDRPS